MERYIPFEQEPPSGGLRDFLTILFKHRTKVWVIFLATVLTVTIGSFLLPPTYEAKSSLMVKMGREYVNRPEVGDTRSLMSLNQEEVVNSEVQILTSRELIEKVLTAMKVETVYPDLAKDPPSNMTPLQAAILAFEKKLTVEGVKKSNVIEVAFQHKDPQVAARAVNLLVDDYKAKHLQVFSDPQSSFLEKQLADYELKLKQSESQMEAYKQKHRVFSLEEQRSLLLKQRMELDTSLKTTRNQVDELQKKLSSLKSQQKARSEDKSNYTLSERDKIIVEARSRLLSLQLKEQDLLKQYTESNRLVLNTRKEIQLVQVFLKEQEAEISGKVRTGNPVYQEVEKETIKTQAELSSQVAKAAALTTAGGKPGERDPVVRPAGQRVPDAEAGSGLQREELPHLPGAARGGPHLGGHEPEEDGQHQRDPGGGRPREAGQAEKGIEHPAGDDPRRRFGPRVRLLLRIHLGELLHPGNRREATGAARAHDDPAQGLRKGPCTSTSIT